LQNINEKLEQELEAAKLLLKQVATGPDHLRNLVLEFIENGKEPLDIVEILNDSGKMDVQLFKAGATRDGSILSYSQLCKFLRLTSVIGAASNSTSPQAFDAQDIKSVGIDSPFT
jgi:hypothetical protein